MEAREQVLVCLRYGIGDVVMEMPALRGLRAQWPHARLTGLGAWPALELLEGDSVFDTLAGIQEFGFQHWWDYGTEESRRQVADWLAGQRFQRILDAGHAVAGIRQLLTGLEVPVLDTGGQLEADDPLDGAGARSIWHSAVRAWGLSETGEPPRPRLHIPDSAARQASDFIREHGLAGQPLVGLVPVASSDLKRWPLEQVCELVRRVTTGGRHHLLVFGVPVDEQATVTRLRDAAAPGTLHLLRPAHLQYTAALMTHCRAVVSNDTGLMHMSAAVDIPTVAIFGPTSPRVFLPAGGVAVSSGVACRHRHLDRFGPADCILRGHCLIGEHSCITRVSVAAVERALTNVLPAGRPRQTPDGKVNRNGEQTMSGQTRAPNRLLDLRELEEPFFADILRQLDTLTRRESISYLHPSKRWEYPWALDRARLQPGSRVLDAGCGASIFPVFLASQGHQVTGVDLSVPQGLTDAHRVRVNYVPAAITDLPFPDESFDTVFCISVIEHLGHQGVPTVLRELRRVLRPGGRLLITTDYYEDANARLWYEGGDRSFPVDWEFFDENHLRYHLLQAPGLAVEGDVDLHADWDRIRPEMRRFHGYPYTSVGVTLVKV